VLFPPWWQLAGVDMLPWGLSDRAALEKAEIQSLKRKASIDGLEVWDRARLIFRRLGPLGPGRWQIVQWWESGEGGQCSATRKSSREAIMARRPLPRYSPGP
jgi:hypothetical protein